MYSPEVWVYKIQGTPSMNDKTRIYVQDLHKGIVNCCKVVDSRH